MLSLFACRQPLLTHLLNSSLTLRRRHFYQRPCSRNRPALARTFGSTSVTTTETFLNLDCGGHGQKASQILMSRKARGFQMLCRLSTWVLILACACKQIQFTLSSARRLHVNSFAAASMRSVHASWIKPTVRSRLSCLSSFRRYFPACPLKAGMHRNIDRPDPLTLFLEFVSEMAETKLTPTHPAAELFLSLVQMRSDH